MARSPRCLVTLGSTLFLFVVLVATAQQSANDKSTGEIYRAGRDGVTMPACTYCPGPEYSDEARKKKYEGVVVLSVVVTVKGKATNFIVLKSPGMGLDEKAIEAVRKWKFEPALKDGKPVDSEVPIEVSFRL